MQWIRVVMVEEQKEATEITDRELIVYPAYSLYIKLWNAIFYYRNQLRTVYWQEYWAQ